MNKKRTLLLLSLLCLLILLPQTTTFAFDGSYEQDMILLGFSFGFGSHGVAFGITFTYQHNQDLYTLRWLCNYNFFRLFHEPVETTWDLGLMYGRISKGSYGFLSASAGIGLTGGTRRGKIISQKLFKTTHEEKNFLTVGMPCQLQGTWVPFGKFWGIGSTTAFNINPEATFVATMATLHFGEMD